MAEQEPLKNAMDTAEGMHQVEGAADDLSGKLLGQVEEVKGMLGELKSEIDKTVSDAATGTGERQQSVEDKIVEGKEKLDVVTGEVGGTVSKAVSDLKELGNKTGEKVSERLEEASDRAVEFIEDAKKAISEKAGEFGEVGKEVGEELSKVLSKGKDKTNEYARDVAGAVSETTNELEEFGKEANNKVSETWDKGNEKMDELAKQTVEKMAELKKEVDEKIAGAVEEGKEKLKGFTEKADEKVDEIKENVVGSEKGVQDSSEETEGLTGKSHYGQTENEPDAGQKLEKQEHLGGIDLTGIGETLKGAVEDISEKISEKINEAREFSEEKLHDADKEHSQKTEEVHDSQGYFRSVDSSAIGDGVKNITEDVSKKVSSKVNVAKEFLEGQLHDEDKGHGQKPSEEAHDKQGYVSGMDFASVGSGLKAMAEDISGKFAERINEGREFLEEKLHDESNLTKEVSEKLKDEKEFQEEKVCGAADEGKQIVHEHMGGIYVKGDTGARDGEFQEEIPKDSHLDRKIDEEREASEHDFLGAADFGGLQSTMKDVFNKGAEKVKEVAEEMLPDSAEHHEEPKVIKKILPAGEDVPEQVGTLSESGVYYDDYEPEKREGSRSSKLEDFVSGKVKDVDKMLEQALNIDKKPNAPEATEIISVEQDDGKQKDTEFAAAADEVRETFEKTRQFPDSTVDLDNSEMESGDNRAEKEQTAEERRHSASGSPRQSPTTKQTEAEQTAIVDNADNEPLTGFTDQAAPPVPEHQELSDVLSSATKHAEEKVYQVTSETTHKDLSQLSSGNEDDTESGPNTPAPLSNRRKMLEEKARSFDVAGGGLLSEEANMYSESRDTTTPLVAFPESFSAKQRSVSLSAEENLREQLRFFDPSVPIPVKIEEVPKEPKQAEAGKPFGVAGPGEILIDTVLVPDAPAAPLLYPIPSETDLEGSADVTQEPEFQHSGSETPPELDFDIKTSQEKETEMVPNLPHVEENIKHAVDEGVANVNEALTSVPEHPISENVPTASESPVLQDTLKFSTAPLVHENAPQPTVQPTAHVQDEEVTKTEIKPLQEKTIEQSSRATFIKKSESRGGPPEFAPPPIPPPKSTVPPQPPVLPPKNAPPPVPPKKKSIEMILAEEAKAMRQRSPRGSEKLVQETVSVKISEEETKAKEEAAPRDESGASEVTDDQKPVKPSTKKAEEKHEMTEKSVPESQNVEMTSSAPVQQPEAKNVETHPVKSTAESKSQEAASEKSKTDTLKSKSVDAQQQQQQQPARRRCTIL